MPATHSDPSIYTRPVEILQRLIRFNTTNPPGNEEACVAYIRGLLTEAGIESTVTIHAANERLPAKAIEFGTRANYKALQKFG